MFLILFYFHIFVLMKESKTGLSAQIDKTSYEKLKAICKKEKRSQAKELEILIDDKFDRLGLKLEK